VSKRKAPTAAQLRDALIARAAAIGLARHGARQKHVAISAIRVALEAIDRELDPERVFLERLGSDEQALAWIDRIRPVLAARVAARGKLLKP